MEQNTTSNMEEREKEIKNHHRTLSDKILSGSKRLFFAGVLVGLLSGVGSLIKIASVTDRYENATPIVRTYNQAQQLLSSLNGVNLELSHIVEYVVPETIQKNLDEVLGQQWTASRRLDDVIMKVEQKLAEMKNIEAVDAYQKRIDRIYHYGTRGGNVALALIALSILFPCCYSATNIKKDAEISVLANP
ncbi:hypothetical protein HYU07_07425 [Candidatus Woesearchaeota archaeon]|nr:hypothetical protein [Candidatus Woesearchaeota archaeon]